jgi:DNA-binding protein HU-beta
MNRTDLIRSVADRTGLTAVDVDSVLGSIEATLVDALARGEKVQLPGVLTVERVERAARSGRNPQTGEALQIPARPGVKVSAGSRLKAAVTGS